MPAVDTTPTQQAPAAPAAPTPRAGAVAQLLITPNVDHDQLAPLLAARADALLIAALVEDRADRGTALGVARTLAAHTAALQRALATTAGAGDRPHARALLRLLVAVVSAQTILAREVHDKWEFGLKSLPKLLGMRRKQNMEAETAAEDARSLYIRFMLALVEHGDTHVRESVLAVKGFLGGIFKGLGDDHPTVVLEVLNTLRRRIIDDDSISRTLKVGFFNAYILEQIATLYKSPAHASVAHEFLRHICTTPGTGVCFRDDGWFSANANGGRVYNKILQQFLGVLKPVDDDRQQVLVLEILRSATELIAGYVKGLRLAFDPRASDAWIKNAAFLIKIIQIAPPPPALLNSRAAANALAAAETTTTPAVNLRIVAENCFPSALSRAILSKGLQHSSEIVQFTSLTLMLTCFAKLDATLALYGDAAISRKQLLGPLKQTQIPDLQIILALQNKYKVTPNDVAYSHIVAVFDNYQRYFPELVVESRYDVTKLLEPLDAITDASLAARVLGVVAASPNEIETKALNRHFGTLAARYPLSRRLLARHMVDRVLIADVESEVLLRRVGRHACCEWLAEAVKKASEQVYVNIDLAPQHGVDHSPGLITLVKMAQSAESRRFLAGAIAELKDYGRVDGACIEALSTLNSALFEDTDMDIDDAQDPPAADFYTLFKATLNSCPSEIPGEIKFMLAQFLRDDLDDFMTAPTIHLLVDAVRRHTEYAPQILDLALELLDGVLSSSSLDKLAVIYGISAKVDAWMHARLTGLIDDDTKASPFIARLVCETSGPPSAAAITVLGPFFTTDDVAQLLAREPAGGTLGALLAASPPAAPLVRAHLAATPPRTAKRLAARMIAAHAAACDAVTDELIAIVAASAGGTLDGETVALVTAIARCSPELFEQVVSKRKEWVARAEMLPAIFVYLETAAVSQQDSKVFRKSLDAASPFIKESFSTISGAGDAQVARTAVSLIKRGVLDLGSEIAGIAETAVLSASKPSADFFAWFKCFHGIVGAAEQTDAATMITVWGIKAGLAHSDDEVVRLAAETFAASTPPAPLTSLDKYGERLKAAIKTMLKHALRDESPVALSAALSALISRLYSPKRDEPRAPIPTRTLIDMIFSHSLFAHVMTAKPAPGATRNAAVYPENARKQHVASILATLVARNACADFDAAKHLEPLFAAYQATRSRGDRALLALFECCERELGISVAPHTTLWGPRGAATRADIRAYGAASGHASSAEQLVCSIVDAAIVKRSIENFGSDDSADSADPSLCCYDERFFYPLLAFLVSASLIDVRRWIEMNFVGLAVMGLSSADVQTRNAAGFILAKVTESMQDAAFREKRQIELLMCSLRNAIALDDEEPASVPSNDRDAAPQATLHQPRVPRIACLFVAHGLTIILQPQHFMYPLVNQACLYRAFMDTGDVPMLFNLLYSSGDNFRRERMWLLHLLKHGIESKEDYDIYRRRHVPELLMGLFEGDLAGKGANCLIIEILKRIAAFPESANLGIAQFIQQSLARCSPPAVVPLLRLYQQKISATAAFPLGAVLERIFEEDKAKAKGLAESERAEARAILRDVTQREAARHWWR